MQCGRQHPSAAHDETQSYRRLPHDYAACGSAACMRVTATLYDEQVIAVERLAAEGMSNAEAVRTIVDEYADAVAERDRLQARVDELQAQLKAVNKKNDANDELANTADRQMSAIERMLMEQQRRRSAGLVTRVKWWLVGDPQMQAELDDELGE